jgi:hypothetical protein
MQHIVTMVLPILLTFPVFYAFSDKARNANSAGFILSRRDCLNLHLA